MDLTQFQLSQMLAPFSRDESQRTVSKIRKRKRKFLCCVHRVHKAGARNVSCYRRAMTATKCTKKRDARAKLLPCQSKPVVFLPFLFSSPSLLVKLPLVVIQKFCYHGNVTSHLSSLKINSYQQQPVPRMFVPYCACWLDKRNEDAGYEGILK